MRYFPPEAREDRVVTGRTWKQLWDVFRIRFGLKSRLLDDNLAIALLAWSLTPDGAAEWLRIRRISYKGPPPASRYRFPGEYDA